MSDEPLYTRVPEGELIWRPLDAVTLVYHRRSGQTHIVVEPVPEIMAAMGEGPVGAAAIAARLAEKYDLARKDAVTLINARLEELSALGLIERTPGHA